MAVPKRLKFPAKPEAYNAEQKSLLEETIDIDLAALAESIPGFELYEWQGILAPAGTPRPAIDRIYAEVSSALRSPEVFESLARFGVEAPGSQPDEFRSYLATELERWRGVARTHQIEMKE